MRGLQRKVCVRSYDVFDTVVTRAVAPPTTVFVLLGRRAAALGLVDVPPGELAAARCDAERAARRERPGGEATLVEIHEELARALALPADASARLLAEELAVERRVLRPVPGIETLLAGARASGAVIAFCSDMYLGSDVIRDVLSDHGLAEPDDVCVVSCDHGATKAAGDLYQVLAARAGHPSRRIAHTGDSFSSDVAQARRQGLVAIHYDATALNRYEQAMGAAAVATDGLAAAMAGASRLARLGTGHTTVHDRALRDVAAGVAAPVLTAYVLWVFVQAAALGVRRLCFASRDGQVLLAIARAVAPRLGVDVELRYLYGSRQAWCLPGLDPMWAASTDPLPPWARPELAPTTPAELLSRLGLAPFDLAAELRSVGLDAGRADEPVGAATEAIHRLFEISSVRTRAQHAAASARELLVGYLEQEGLIGDTPWAVVDLGWRGFATGSLAAVVEGAGGSRPVEMYLGLRPGAPLPGARRRSWLPDGAVDGLRRIETLLEAFTAGDHGRVIGYERGADGRVLPVLRTPENPAVLEWGLPTVRATIARFVDELVLDHDLVDPWADVREVATGLLAELWLAPTVEEARAWGAFPYEDGPPGEPVRLGAPLRLADVPAVARGQRPVAHWKAGEDRTTPAPVRGIATAVRTARVTASRLRRRR